MKEILFKVIIDYLKNNEFDEDFNNSLINITEGIRSNFKSEESLDRILQRMINAYITEKYTLNFLNNGRYWDKISRELVKFGYRGAPSEIYVFNNVPNNHRVYSANLCKEFLPDERFFDILGDDYNREHRDSYKIEVKATVSDKLDDVTNFHNADIVFIYVLDTKELYFKHKKLFDDYSDLVYLDKVDDLDTLQIKFVDNKFILK